MESGDLDRLFGRTIWGMPVVGPFDPRTVKPGRFDMRVLEQCSTWVDELGASHQLHEMPATWRRNIVAFLYAKARGMHAIESAYQAIGAGCSWAEWMMARDIGVTPVGDVDPYVWLESLPLLRRLRELDASIASPAELRIWADAAHRKWANDPQAVVVLPQDPQRVLDQ